MSRVHSRLCVLIRRDAAGQGEVVMHSKFRSTSLHYRVGHCKAAEMVMNCLNKKAANCAFLAVQLTLSSLFPRTQGDSASPALSGSTWVASNVLQLLVEVGGRPCRQGIPPVQRTAQPVTCSRLPDTVNTVNVNTDVPLSRSNLSRSFCKLCEEEIVWGLASVCLNQLFEDEFPSPDSPGQS